MRALRDVQLLLDECSAGRGATADTRATPTYRVVTTTNKWARRTEIVGATPAFGMLVLASPDPQRFASGMGTDFLERIAELASAALSRLREE